MPYHLSNMTISIPSLRSLAKLAIGSAQLFLGTAEGAIESGLKSCPNPQLSCHNTTVIKNTCCFNSPGGQLLQTQFWDTNPATGPHNHWTIHGLWPDHCDGTFDQFCDPNREYTNITDILRSYHKHDLLKYMREYWPDYQGNDESFWEHEWDKHGTCISTLEPRCYNNYKPQLEVVNFFNKTVELFKGLDSFKYLSEAGIVPSKEKSYSFDQIQRALRKSRGVNATIQCSGAAGNELDEIWYHFNVRGSVQTGHYVAAEPDGSKSDCPDTILYLPKEKAPITTSSTASMSITTSASSTNPTATSTPFSGKGFLDVYQGDAENGCIISYGTWYTTGTCATYTGTLATDGSISSLKGSKGYCQVTDDGVLGCQQTSADNATVFQSQGSMLSYNGSTAFYAETVATGSVQETVYTVEQAVPITIVWQPLSV